MTGVARSEKNDVSFRAEMKAAVSAFSRRKPIDAALWSDFERGIRYHRGAASDPATFESLRAELEQADAERGAPRSKLFYLAVPPNEFGPIVEGLRASRSRPEGRERGGPWTRVVFEKPFGHDLASARSSTTRSPRRSTSRRSSGSTTISAKRRSRTSSSSASQLLFEPVWGREHVDHVQITVAEEIGVEGRGKFYEQTGVTRDIVENHLMQLLCLTAMEPPISLSADAVRDEKVKALRSLRRLEHPGGLVPLAPGSMVRLRASGTSHGPRRCSWRPRRAVRVSVAREGLRIEVTVRRSAAPRAGAAVEVGRLRAAGGRSDEGLGHAAVAPTAADRDVGLDLPGGDREGLDGLYWRQPAKALVAAEIGLRFPTPCTNTS